MDTNEDRCWRQLRLALLFALLLPGPGCQAPVPALPSARPLGRDLEVASPARLDTRQAPETIPEPLGALTLQAALGAALGSSPRLEAYGWRVRAEEARALQAGLLPNPTLRVEGENFAGSGSLRGYDAAETTVSLGQLVELGGKRAERRRVAMLDRELSGWDYETARLDVLTATTQRYVAALAARDRLALSAEILRVARASLGATRVRVRAGAASSIEDARSAVAVATIEVENERLRVEFDAAKQSLASSWGAKPKFTTLSGDLADLQELPSLETLSAALSDNPDLARWASEVSRREAALELARSGAIPDVTAGLGVRHFNQSNDAALIFGIEIPLPLFDRNQGARAAAHAEANRARAQSREARLVLSRALISAHADALGAFEGARALNSRVLPQARAAHERTEDAYRKGLFRLVDVLDAQRTLFDARTEYVNALARYHTARAALERLAGSPLAELGTRSH